MFAGGKTVVSGLKWTNLGTRWTYTLLGSLAVAFVLINFVFYNGNISLAQSVGLQGRKCA
jgi:hypothetical protein